MKDVRKEGNMKNIFLTRNDEMEARIFDAFDLLYKQIDGTERSES